MTIPAEPLGEPSPSWPPVIHSPATEKLWHKSWCSSTAYLQTLTQWECPHAPNSELSPPRNYLKQGVRYGVFYASSPHPSALCNSSLGWGRSGRYGGGRRDMRHNKYSCYIGEVSSRHTVIRSSCSDNPSLRDPSISGPPPTPQSWSVRLVSR